MNVPDENASMRGWARLLHGGMTVSLGFILLRFLVTPLRMQVLTRVLAPEDYGMVTLLSMTANAMAIVLSAGGFELLLRQLPGAAPGEQLRIFRRVLAVSSLLGLAACACVLLGFVPSFKSGAASLSRGAVVALFLLFLHTQQRLYFLLGCRHYVRARVTQLLWSDVWFLAIIPWGLTATWTAEGAVWAWSAWLLLMIGVTWRWVPLRQALAAGRGGAAVGGMLALGLPMLPVVLAEWTFRLVGQFVLLAQADAEAMALYALAFNIAGIGYVVGVPLIDSLSTEFNAVQRSGGSADDLRTEESLCRIVSRAVRFIMAVTVPVGLAFVFLAQPIVRLLSGPAFARTAELLPWTAMIPCLLLTNLLLARLLLASRRSPSAGLGSLAGAVTAMGLCLAWVHPYGARGALMAVTCGLAVTTVFMACRAHIFRWMDPLQVRWGQLVAGGVLLATAFAALGIPDALPILRLAAAGGITVAVALGFGWLGLNDFSPDGAPRNGAQEGARHA